MSAATVPGSWAAAVRAAGRSRPATLSWSRAFAQPAGKLHLPVELCRHATFCNYVLFCYTDTPVRRPGWLVALQREGCVALPAYCRPAQDLRTAPQEPPSVANTVISCDNVTKTDPTDSFLQVKRAKESYSRAQVSYLQERSELAAGSLFCWREGRM